MAGKDGKILASDFSEADKIVADLDKIDKKMVELLGRMSALAKESGEFKTLSQGNAILKERVKVQSQVATVEEKATKQAILLAKAKKEQANAEAATQRAQKATLATQQAQVRVEEKATKQAILLSKAKKEQANAEAATQRAQKATLATQQAQVRAQEGSVKSTNTNIQQLKSLNSFYQQQSRLLNKLRDDYKSLELRKQQGIKLSAQEAAQYTKLRQQVTALDSSLKKVDAAAGQFNRSVGNYSKGARALVSGLRALVGAFGVTSGIFLFASAVKNAFDRVREFDKSMQNLAGIMRTSRSEVSDLEAEIIRVAGASVKTSREVAGLAESLVTLGKSKDEIKKLLEPVNNLAIGLEASSEEAAEFFVQTLNAFGAGADEADEYADIIATIRTSTALDFQKMRDSFQYLTPISRILNEDLAYTGALLGIMADNGLKAEQAGRLLGTAEQKLAASGLSLADALQIINDAQAEGKTGLELLAIASDLFGKQAAKVGIILANNSDRIQENAQAIRDNGGALDDLIKEQLKSLDARLKILDSTWEELILTIENGNGSIANGFRSFIGLLTQAIKSTIELEKAQSKVYDVTGKTETLWQKLGNSTYLIGIPKKLLGIENSYEKLVSLQKQLSKGNATIDDNGLEILRAQWKSLNETLDENEDLTLEQRQLYREQIKVVEEAIIRKNEERQALRDTAIEMGYAESNMAKYADVTILSIQQLKEWIKENKKAAGSLKKINEDFEGSANTIEALEEKLKTLKDAFEKADIGSDAFNSLKTEIKSVQAELDAAYGSGKKSAEQFTKNTIAYYEDLISQQEKFIKNTATTAEQIQQANAKIEEYRKAIEALNGIKLEPLVLEVKAKLDVGDPSGVVGVFKEAFESVGLDNIIDEDALKTSTEAAISELEKYNEARKSGEEAYTQFLKDQKDRQVEIVKGVFDTFSQYYGFDASAFTDLFDSKKNDVADFADAAKELNQLLFSSITEDYAIDREANQARLDAILDDEEATDEQKAIAKEKYRKEEQKLKKKEFEANKKAALIGIAIDTAAGIIKSWAQPGYPQAIALSVIIGALGAIQAGIVASKKFPNYFIGTQNAPGGPAWTDEKGAEIHTDRHGRIKDFGSDKGPRLKWLDPGDRIFTAEHTRDIIGRYEFSPKDEMRRRLDQGHRFRINMKRDRDDRTWREVAALRADMRRYAGKPTPVNVTVKNEQPYNHYR